MLKILNSNKSFLVLNASHADKIEPEFHKPEEINTQKRKPLESLPIPDRNIQQTAFHGDESMKKPARTSHKKLDSKHLGGHTPTNLSKLMFETPLKE